MTRPALRTLLGIGASLPLLSSAAANAENSDLPVASSLTYREYQQRALMEGVIERPSKDLSFISPGLTSDVEDETEFPDEDQDEDEFPDEVDEDPQSPGNDNPSDGVSYMPELPQDIFDIGFGNWDKEPGAFPKSGGSQRELLGVHYNEYFERGIAEMKANANGGLTFLGGRHPTYLRNGFQGFRTIGPWTTRGYTVGYYGTKAVLGYLLAKKAGDSKAIGGKPGNAGGRGFGRKALKSLQDYVSMGGGEVVSGLANYLDNTDVMEHNTIRMMEIMHDPRTFMSPMSMELQGLQY